MTPLQAHLARVAAWAVLGLVVALPLLRRGPADRFARQCGIQLAAWGAVNLALVAAGWRGDAPAAWFLWLNVGLDVGYSAVGATLLLCGRHFRVPGLVGAGVGVLPQGIVLALLDLWFLRVAY